jgi:hypothetical protein
VAVRSNAYVCGRWIARIAIRVFVRNLSRENSIYPDSGYTDRLGPSGEFVENSTKLTCPKLPVVGSSTVQCYDF